MLLILLNLSNDAVLDVNNAVGLICHAALVRYHYYSHAILLVELCEEVHHLHAGLGVEGAGRLIGKYYSGW